MANRKGVLILILVFAFVMIIVLTIARINQNEALLIGDFEVSDYQYYIENCPSEEIIGSVNDVNILVKSVEEIWVIKYGESVRKQKPYQVLYDEEAEIWLVQGTLSHGKMGGVANILVANGTGKVLAIWHEK